MKNILYLSGINNNSQYGYYNAVYKRMEHLSKLNISITFISLPLVDNCCVRLLKYLFNMGIDIEPKKDLYINYIPIKRTLLNYIYKDYQEENIYKTIVNLCAKHDIELIHVHWAYPYGYIASKICKKLGIPYVLNVHGSDIHTNPFINKNIMRKTVEALNNASEIYYVSRDLYDTAISLPNMLNDNFAITGNAIKILKIPKRINQNKKFHICFIGALTKVKGADRLIPIFKILNQYMPDIKLSIIGNGPLYNEIQKEINNKKLNIKLLGFLEHEKINTLRESFDLSIVPSRSEGFGLVVLESYAYSTPVIATKCGGLSNLIIDQELLIDDNVDYIKNIAICIQNYYKNYNYYLNRTDVYSEYIQGYSWENLLIKESKKYENN